MPPQQVRDWPEELSTVMSQNNPSWIPMDYTSVLPFSLGFFHMLSLMLLQPSAGISLMLLDGYHSSMQVRSIPDLISRSPITPVDFIEE